MTDMTIHEDLKKAEELQLATPVAKSHPNMPHHKWEDYSSTEQRWFLDLAASILKTHVVVERPKVCPYPDGSNCPHL